MTCDIPAEDIDGVMEIPLRYISRLGNAIANIRLRKPTRLTFGFYNKGSLSSNRGCAVYSETLNKLHLLFYNQT